MCVSVLWLQIIEIGHNELSVYAYQSMVIVSSNFINSIIHLARWNTPHRVLIDFFFFFCVLLVLYWCDLCAIFWMYAYIGKKSKTNRKKRMLIWMEYNESFFIWFKRRAIDWTTQNQYSSIISYRMVSHRIEIETLFWRRTVAAQKLEILKSTSDIETKLKLGHEKIRYHCLSNMW